MTQALPISSNYRKPIFEALGRQVLLGVLSLLVLDGGTAARICGIALVAFLGRGYGFDLAAATITDVGRHRVASVRLFASGCHRVLSGPLYLEDEGRRVIRESAAQLHRQVSSPPE